MQSWDVIYESCIGLFVPHQAETGHPGIQTYWMSVMKIVIQIRKYTNTQIHKYTNKETGPHGIQSYRLLVMKIPATWKTVERENLEKTESKFKMECR